MRTLSCIALGSLFVCWTPASAQMQSLGNKDTVAVANISEDEFHEIVGAVKKSAYDVPKSWKAELRFRRIDLGNYPGLAVQGTNLLCGGTGNCQIWLFRKANAHWTPLFGNEQTILAEGFEFGRALANGIKDLTIINNVSAYETKRTNYKFNGRRYTIR
jgi:hypothetical protein